MLLITAICNDVKMLKMTFKISGHIQKEFYFLPNMLKSTVIITFSKVVRFAIHAGLYNTSVSCLMDYSGLSTFASRHFCRENI